MFGTTRSLIQNAMEGVTEGYEKKLEIHGSTYRVKLEGTALSFNLGWNHPVIFPAPEFITFEVPDEATIIIRGHDKQKVGEISAKIRKLRPPEPYKGKGIRYEGEYVKRKSPKTVA